MSRRTFQLLLNYCNLFWVVSPSSRLSIDRNYSWAALTAIYALIANVGPSSVRCPSVLWSYLKTWARQTHVKHYIKVGTADSVAALRSSRGKIFWFEIKYAAILLYGLLFDVASAHSCCQPSTTVVTPQLLSTVVKVAQRSETVIRIIDERRCQPASFSSGDALVLSPVLQVMPTFVFYFLVRWQGPCTKSHRSLHLWRWPRINGRRNAIGCRSAAAARLLLRTTALSTSLVQRLQARRRS